MTIVIPGMGDDIALISVLLQYAAGDGAEGENAGI